MEEKDWFWQDDSYKLDAESPLAISRSLWDGLAQSEADSRSLFATTPTTDTVDSGRLPSSFYRKGKLAEYEESKEVPSDISPREGSPRLKRRRMLRFSGSEEESSTTCDNTPVEAAVDSPFGIGGGPMIPVCEEFERFEVPVPTSPSSLWYLQNDESQFAVDETLEPASEKWMARCFGDYQVPMACDLASDPTKLAAPVSDKSGDCSSNQHQEFDCPSTPFARSPNPGRRMVPMQSSRPKSVTPVAYPFALLKPCGAQGDVTLHDINQRISMPPSRPGPQSGEDSRPAPQAGSGGLSGKSVVALTKIHTEGNGTITIMRTRG